MAVPLSDAIEALRSTLEAAMAAGAGRQLRFEAEPIELTLEVAVTKASTGQAGIKWWLVSAGAEINREMISTQSIKLTLSPVTTNEAGVSSTVLIDARDD